MNSKMTFAATSLLLAGVLAVTYGCASSSDESSGGSSGSNSSSSSTSSGSAGSGGGGSGGSSGSGDSSKPVASGDSITFTGGKAEGVFSGYGWVALGKDDKLTSPTCGDKEITNADPCKDTTTWAYEGTDKLCMSGSIPALPASPAQADYDNNWGVQIGVNAADPEDAVGDAAKDFKTVTFTVSGDPKSGLRAMLHRRGDPDGTTYCYDSLKSGTAITLTKFNTKCWGDKDTVNLTAEDLPTLDKIGVQVSSTASAIEVKDVCIEKIEFGK